LQHVRRGAAVCAALVSAACSHGAVRPAFSPLPIATGDYPAYGHAPDYSWLAGRLAQRPNGCVYLVFAPTGRAPFGGRLALNADPSTLHALPGGDMIVAFGRFSSAPQGDCGRGYVVARIEEH
jgi:hypothetical protein